MQFKELLRDKSWKRLLSDELKKPYIKELEEFLEEERKDFLIYPAEENIFNAFNLTSFENLKVVIIGQDPYHGAAQAHGLAFSVLDDTPLPPSLRNIFTEYTTDLHLPMPLYGDLSKWAKEGVFLINAVLTVRAGEPTSHKNKGWEKLSDSDKDSNRYPARHFQYVKLPYLKKHNCILLYDTAKKLTAIGTNIGKMEHNRWNAEKLLTGFVKGDNNIPNKTDKDLRNRLKYHYCICPWESLDPDNQMKDIDPTQYLLKCNK